VADEVKEFTDPGLEGYSDEAFEPPGEGGLTTEQLAFRLHAKREQAMQDTGAISPPVADVEPLEEEAPAVVEEEPEAPLEEEPEEPEAEPEEEPTEEEPEEPEEPPEDEVDEFFLARYRDRESAEEGLAEKDRTIAALYRQLHEREQALQQQPEQPEQLDTAAWSEWAAESVENGAGLKGAQQALESGGPQGFDIYMAHWLAVEDPEERVQATAFNNEVIRQHSAQIALQAVQPEIEKSHERTVEEEAQTAKQLVAAEHPDFDDYTEDMDRLIRDQNGLLPEETKKQLAEIAQNGVEGKRMAWEHLYLAARAARGPRRQQAQTVEKERRTKRADAAKIAATVSTAEGSGAHTPPNAAEQAVLQKRNAIRQRLGQPELPME
jgi:hypothetical protein